MMKKKEYNKKEEKLVKKFLEPLGFSEKTMKFQVWPLPEV
jgi:hypothetical protein